MRKSLLGTLVVLFWIPWFCTAQTQQTFPLKVGTAKIDVTPANHPVAPATGKYDHERLYTRAIVLDNGVTSAALISFDCRIEKSMWINVYKQVTDELNCPAENVIISPNHTHSNNWLPAPGGNNGANVPPATPEEVQLMANSIVKAVREAKAKLQPALAGFGRGMSYLNVSRNVIDPVTRKWTQAASLDGWADKSIDVIKFETPEGKPIAVFMNYSIHPVNGYVLGVHSADIPGAVSRYVEKAFNDEIIATFSQGIQGDLNPLYLRPSTNAMSSRAGIEITGYELNREQAEGPLRMIGKPEEAKPVDAKVLDNLFRFIESQGQVLGEEVIRVMTATKKMTGDVYIAGQQKTVTCPGRKRTDGNSMDPSTREGVPGVYEDAEDVSFKLGTLGIGTTAIVWTDGDPFSYIGLRVKKESPLTNTMFLGMANIVGGTAGYLPNDAAYGQQGFQVLNTRFKPGCAEEAIVDTMIEMVTEYLDK